MRSARTLIGIVAATLVAGCEPRTGHWTLVREPAATDAQPAAATQPEPASRPADNLAQDNADALDDEVAMYLARVRSAPAEDGTQTTEPTTPPASRPAEAARVAAPASRREVVASPAPPNVRAVAAPVAEATAPTRSSLPEPAPAMAALPNPANRPAVAVNAPAEPLGVEIVEVRAAQANAPTPDAGTATQPEGTPNLPVAGMPPRPPAWKG